MAEHHRISLLMVTLMCLVLTAATMADDVTVDATTLHTIAGESLIPKGIFGGTAANNTGHGFDRPEFAGARMANDARLGMVRLSFDGLGSYLPAQRPAVLSEDLTELFDMGIWQRDHPPNRSRIGPILRNFAAHLEAEPLVMIADTGGWLISPGRANSVPLDNDEFAEFVAAHVRLMKKEYPDLKYVHLANEPNATWGRHFGWAGQQSEAYVEYFVTIARRLRREFPDLAVGGPVLAKWPHFPPTEGWRNWEWWSKALINEAGRDLGFFDWHDNHMDDLGPQMTAFSLEIVTAEAMRSHGYYLRTIISEANTNFSLPNKRDEIETLSIVLKKRTIAWQRYLWTLLRQRDKALGSLWHDLAGPRGITAAPHKDGYWVYWIFRNLRGDALWTVAPDATLPALASLEQNRVNVVVWNDSDKPRPVELAVQVPPRTEPRWSAEKLEWDLEVNGGKGRVIHEPMFAHTFVVSYGKRLRGIREGNTAFIRWQAQPWASSAIYATFPRPPVPTMAVKQQEFFSDTVMARLNVEAPSAVIEFDVDGQALEQAEKMYLRMGLLDVAREDQLTIQAGEWETTARAGLVQNYEFPAPFIKAGRNRCTLSARVEKDDRDIVIGYVSAVVVSKPASLN